MSVKQFGDEIVAAVRALIDARVADVNERIALVQSELAALVASKIAEAIAQLPVPKDGVDGKDGRDGIDGKDGAPGKDGEKGQDGVDGKDGRDGIDGKDGADGRHGKDGKDGIDGKDGAPGLDGKDGLRGEKGADGRDGKDGISGKDGRDGMDGKDGEHGRDALEIRPVELDATKSYPRGTYAFYRGGLIHAQRKTSPLLNGGLEAAGWMVAVNGIASMEVDRSEHGARFIVRTTAGEVNKVPIPSYRQIFKLGETYLLGDMVTFGGSVWAATKDNAQGKPGEPGSDWVLAVKHGRDLR
jgi:hypothetical protein